MRFSSKQEYSEDMFADTRMTFGDHLEDLRLHLWRAIVGFVLAMLISFAPAKLWVLPMIAAPVEKATQAFYDERVDRIMKERQQGNEELAKLNRPVEQSVELSTEDLAKFGITVPESQAED